MRRLGGQAWRGLHRLLRAVMALALLGGLALGWVAWRLNEGPLELPALARAIEAAAPLPEGVRLEVGSAAIAWEGWRDGAAPLDVRVTAVRLRDARGAVKAELPDAAISFSGRALLRGVLAPSSIELRRPSLLAVRRADGGIDLDLGTAPAGGAAAEEADGDAALQALRDLMRPESDATSHGALRRLRLAGGVVTLLDQPTGRRFSMEAVQLDIRRAAAGGMAGEGRAMLRLGGLAVPVRLSAAAAGTPMRISAGVGLPALHPAQLAEALPELAALSLLDAPVAISAEGRFAADGQPLGAEARLDVGPGHVDLGSAGRIAIQSMAAQLTGSGRALHVDSATLSLPGGPVLAAEGDIGLRDGAWQGRLEVRLTGVDLAQLSRHWPATLAPVQRAATLAAAPSGRLEQARLRLEFAVPEAIDGFSLQAAQGGIRLRDAVMVPAPGMPVRAEQLDLQTRYAPGLLVLEELALRLARPAGASGPAPTLSLHGEARLAEAEWQAALALGLDTVGFAELPHYWPAALAPNVREWITGNITAGTVRQGRWELAMAVPPTLDGGRVTGFRGTADITGATVHWLRPVPPADQASGSAEFALDGITVRLQTGRQRSEGERGLDLRGGEVRFLLDRDPEQVQIALTMAGALPELVTVLRHPRLHLFDKRPLPVVAHAGQADVRLSINFPLLRDLPMELLQIRANARMQAVRLSGLPMGQELERGSMELSVDTDTLRVQGEGLYAGIPVRVVYETDFRNGPATQVTERATVTGRAEVRQLGPFGIGFATGVAAGPVGIDLRSETRRNGQNTVTIRGDLRDTRLAVPAVNWSKPAGVAATIDSVLRIQGDNLQLVDGIRVDAPGMALRGRAVFGRGTTLQRIEIAESAFAAARFVGDARPPERSNAPWLINLRGPVLDLRPVLDPPPQEVAQAQAMLPENRDGSVPPLLIDLRFDRATMGEGRDLRATIGRLRTDSAGLIREATASGRTGANAGFELAMVPQGNRRQVRITADDGGALMRALDLFDSVQGGRLTLNAAYAELRPGAPLSGTIAMEEFVLRDAPSMGRILQAMTLYGVGDAIRSSNGLSFSRLVAPFTLTPEYFIVDDARAFSASLGVTARGRIRRGQTELDLQGTIVPAYMFNTLLGNLPIIGRLFSPEAGGGLIAATYRMQGSPDNPRVTMNPLAALTPGFLRGIFGLVEEPAGRRAE